MNHSIVATSADIPAYLDSIEYNLYLGCTSLDDGTVEVHYE